MMLGYIDEAGIAYEKTGTPAFFKDGSHALWAAILVSELKYPHIESNYIELTRKILGVNNWQEKELHATDIWNRTGDFSSLTEKKSREYFAELFQLLAKFQVPVVVGIQQKNPKIITVKAKERELERAVHALLHGIEHRLALLDQNAVLIADETGSSDSQSVMQKILLERMRWHHNPGMRPKRAYKTKYYFESQSCFVRDQLHHIKSKDSLFIQLADQINFVLQRVITFSYLKKFPISKPVANLARVPVDPATFNWFAVNCALSVGIFDEQAKDVSFTSFRDFGPSNSFLTEATVHSSEWSPYK